MTQPVFFIVNPVSGGYSEAKIGEVMDRLRDHHWSPELLVTGCAEDTIRFARRICREVANPHLIVGGGDGTINGVLNGLTPGVATIGILPLGTANVLAKELGILSLEDAVHKLERPQTRPLAVGVMEGAGASRYFVLMVGAGFDGAIVKGVRPAEKRVIGKGAYLLAAVRTLFSWDPSLLTVECNGGTIQCHTVIVCNGSRYGGNFLLARQTDIFTPGFQLVCVTDNGRWTYFGIALALVTGQVPHHGVEMVSAIEVAISGGKPVQIDGDHHEGDSLLRLRSIPDFARIIV